ncbi:MAG: tyrosine-type recombinase/integrase [Pseudomonadota bacterium]
MSKRQANKLTARGVAALVAPGWHSDGAGLYVRITPDGRKSWVVVYFTAGRRREMGLGAAAGPKAITLGAAREEAARIRAAVVEGRCPLSEKRDARASEAAPKAIHTFGTVAEAFMRMRASAWKNPKHGAQWQMTLRTHAKSLWEKPVDAIATRDVLDVLEPIWTKTPETAARTRNRIELVLDSATAQGLREGPNPARWRGHLKSILPARTKHTRGHFAAMDYRGLPAFMERLRAQRGIGARALELTILTACRTSEVIEAEWIEIDLAAATWTIPAHRMKAGRLHKVPLSPQAVALLAELNRNKTGPYVFSFNGRKPLSNMTMLKVLRAMGEKVTAHGFRASFRTWAGEVSNAPRDIVEACLAHTIENAAERAYVRGDFIAKRAALMKTWAEWCEPRPADNVVPLHAAASA